MVVREIGDICQEDTISRTLVISLVGSDRLQLASDGDQGDTIQCVEGKTFDENVFFTHLGYLGVSQIQVHKQRNDLVRVPMVSEGLYPRLEHVTPNVASVLEERHPLSFLWGGSKKIHLSGLGECDVGRIVAPNPLDV